jgi:hypothetical protein
MDHTDVPTALMLRVGISALVGAVAQIALFAALERGHALGMVVAFGILPPSVVPTVCVGWSLARSRALFPGSGGWPVAFAVGSWHLGLLLLTLLGVAGISFRVESAVLGLSMAATIPVSVAVWRLVRYWDWGYALAMLGTGAAVGAVWVAGGNSPVFALATTVLWSTAVGLLAGFWLTRAIRSPGSASSKVAPLG